MMRANFFDLSVPLLCIKIVRTCCTGRPWFHTYMGMLEILFRMTNLYYHVIAASITTIGGWQASIAIFSVNELQNCDKNMAGAKGILL